MLKKLLFCLVAGPSALFMTAAPSDAAVVYQYTTGKSAYTMPANGTMQVPLFLKETLTDGSASIITKDTGLYGVGLQINRETAGLPASPSILSTLTPNTTDFTGNTTKSNSPTSGIFSVNVGNSPNGILLGNTGGGAVENPASAGMIYAGMATITAGGPGTTTFTLQGYPGAGTSVTNSNFYDLDVSQTGTDAFTGTTPSSFTVTVDGVPEPTSFSLLVVGGCVVLARRRRVTVPA